MSAATRSAPRSLLAAFDALFGPLEHSATPVPWARFFGLSAVLMAIIVARRPDIVTNPQFFAEDGFVYFPQNILLGPRAFLELHHGFPHFMQRLIAFLAGIVPPLHAPRFYCTAAALLTAFGLAAFVLPSFRHLVRHDGLRALFALGVVTMPLVPFDEQTIGTVANLGWFLAVWLTLSAVMRRPRSAWSTIVVALTATGAALSTPLAAVNIPLWSLRLLRGIARRDRLDAFYAALPLVAFCVTIFMTPNLGARTELQIGERRLSFSVSGLFSYVAARTALFLAPLDTVRAIRDIDPAALPALACGGIAALLLLGGRDRRTVAARLLAIYGLVASIAITLFGRVVLGLLDPLYPPARYGVFPAAMLCLATVASLDSLTARWSLALATVVVAALGSWVRQASFFIPPLPDMNWPHQAPRFERALREHCPVHVRVRLNPKYLPMDVLWGPEFSEPPTNQIAAKLAGGNLLAQPFVSRCEGLTEVAFHLPAVAPSHGGELRMDLYQGPAATLVASASISRATLKPEWNVFCFPPIRGSRDASFVVSLRMVGGGPGGAVPLRATRHDPAAAGGAELDGVPMRRRAALMHGCVERTVPRLPLIERLLTE